MGSTAAATAKRCGWRVTASAVLWLSIFKGVFGIVARTETLSDVSTLLQQKTQRHRTSLGMGGSDGNRELQNQVLARLGREENYNKYRSVANDKTLLSALQLESVRREGTEEDVNSNSSVESDSSNQEDVGPPNSRVWERPRGQSPKNEQEIKAGEFYASNVKTGLRVTDVDSVDTSQNVADVSSEKEVPPQPDHLKAKDDSKLQEEYSSAMPSAEGSTIESRERDATREHRHAEIRSHTDQPKHQCSQGKCYRNLHERSHTTAMTVLEKSQKNPHFTNVNQEFCDELFRLIDGPFPVSRVSAFLREADTADKMEKNFRYCLASAASSGPRVEEGYSILHAAVASHKPQILELLLQYGAFPNMPLIPIRNVSLKNVEREIIERVNMRPIHVAAEIQGVDGIQCIDLLLNYEAEVDSRDAMGRTPLMTAARNNTPMSPDFVKKLINAGSDVHAKDLAGLQALHYAVVEDNWRVVKILLDHQADPLVVDVEGNSPLHYAASFNAIHSINKLLDKAGQFIKLNSVNSSGKAAIHLASAPDSYQAVSKSVVPAMALEALLHHHADPLLRDDDGNNALHLASKGGYVEIVKRLISTTSMPVEEKNLAGQTALQLVEESQHRATQEVKDYLRIYSEKKSCVEPPLVRDSIRIFSDTVLGPYMRIGDTVTYICNDGYELFGHASITCQERNGKMEFVPQPPLCLPKTEAQTADATTFQPYFTYGLAALAIVNILVMV